MVIALLVGAVVAISAVSQTKSTFGAAVINSSTGLEFAMSMNSTTVQMGHDLGVSFNLFNTLDRVNNITAAEDWRLGNGSELACGGNGVFGIEVVKGSYNLNDFSQGTPLNIFVFVLPLGFNQCLFYIRGANSTGPPLWVPWYGTNYYVFNPKSNVAQWMTSGIYNVPPNPHPLPNSTGSCSPCNRVDQRAIMNETVLLRPALFTNSTGVFTVIGGDMWGDLETLHFYVGPVATQTTSSSTATALGPTYTVNGLTCHVPAAYQSYPSVVRLLPLVTANPRFLNLTGGMPFVFGNAENITDRIQQVGNQLPVHLPDVLEMVFYSIGPNTSCGMLLGISETTIDVQVPIQNGGYNMTGATFNESKV